MLRTLISYKGEKITIDNKAMYSGGEGSIFPVIGHGPKRVAKLYHSPEKAQYFHQKILFMVNNPPFDQKSKAFADTVIWPQDLLFENNQFVGYVMKLVEGGIKLFMLAMPKLIINDKMQPFAKFDPANPECTLIRLKICYNLAQAVNLLHQSGKYVLVDLKPENVLIKPNGHFSIIDLDSIQIVQNKKLLFHASAFTPEYTPPELHQGKLVFGKDRMPESFDLFSLAIIHYQLLINIHPFQASHNQYTTIQENIQHGLYVHGVNSKQLAVIPAIHKKIKQLPLGLQKQFYKAFDTGFSHPNSRPNAAEWAKTLLHEIELRSHKKKLNFLDKLSSSPSFNNGHNIRINSQNDFKNKIGYIFHNYLLKLAGSYNTLINNTKGLGKALSLRVISKPKSLHLSNIYKYAAIVFFFVFCSILVIAFTLKKDLRNKATYSHNDISTLHFLPGKYLGVVNNGIKDRKLAYLQIYQSDSNSSKFAVRLLADVLEYSIIEELIVNPETNQFSSVSLGNGQLKIKQNGAVTLYSTKQNPISWYFAKQP